MSMCADSRAQAVEVTDPNGRIRGTELRSDL